MKCFWCNVCDVIERKLFIVIFCKGNEKQYSYSISHTDKKLIAICSRLILLHSSLVQSDWLILFRVFYLVLTNLQLSAKISNPTMILKISETRTSHTSMYNSFLEWFEMKSQNPSTAMTKSNASWKEDLDNALIAITKGKQISESLD